MFRHSVFAAWFVSIYLLVYTLLLASGYKTLCSVAVIMLLFSPLFLIWLVYSVVGYGQFDDRELKDGEEFGYSDWPNGR